jgi:hypothetical protein
METTAGLNTPGPLLVTIIVLLNAFLFLLFLWILSSLQNYITRLAKMKPPREEEPYPLLALLALLHQLGLVLQFYLLQPVPLKLVVPLQRLTPLPMVALQYQNFHRHHHYHPHHLLLGLSLLPPLQPPLRLPVLHTSIQSIDPILIIGHHRLHHHHQQTLKHLLATLHHHATKIHHLPLVLSFVTHLHLHLHHPHISSHLIPLPLHLSLPPLPRCHHITTKLRTTCHPLLLALHLSLPPLFHCHFPTHLHHSNVTNLNTTSQPHLSNHRSKVSKYHQHIPTTTRLNVQCSTHSEFPIFLHSLTHNTSWQALSNEILLYRRGALVSMWNS